MSIQTQLIKIQVNVSSGLDIRHVVFEEHGENEETNFKEPGRQFETDVF